MKNYERESLGKVWEKHIILQMIVLKDFVFIVYFYFHVLPTDDSHQYNFLQFFSQICVREKHSRKNQGKIRKNENLKVMATLTKPFIMFEFLLYKT